ncbi:carboxypeptidase-like regulatory domain-containing protein [Frigoribacterium sp. VKM Ac-2836]|uniref:carboxypeptidase-like regulatory domain-containing protein n=1 Tax=Frigoribacterium sp. VKM Ac-2836 TaxID=2739014 RepID=UPI001565E641|nr:carboxypeptidase-like regulatory domain-containing protein [Frigoribacterium sp. VKM Ac-2836]NRD26666.1 carboxypeptidase regulatory-like domain-containing protein [Frigoribacterium sp. VKM Ac-2836]
MFQRLSDRLRPADPDDRDAGLSIVEVVVALLVFAIISVGSIVAVGTTLALSSDNRNREVAANLAAQAVDTARGVNDVVSVSSGTTTTTVNGTIFTVAQTAAFVTTTGVDTTCTPAASSGNGSLFYKRLQISVTWPGMRKSTAPVRSDTILAPNSRLNDQDTGTILVGVKDTTGAGVSGLVVTVEPDDKSSAPGKALASASRPGLTNGDGCAVAIKVLPGSYKVTVSRADAAPWRDAYQSQAPVKTGIVVAKGDSAGVSFTYDLGDDFAVKYASTYTGGTFLLPNDLKTTVLGGPLPYTINGNVSDVYLFPKTTGYQMIAGDYRPTGAEGGSCLSPDPAAWPANPTGKTAVRQPFVAASAGGASYDLPMGVTTVKLASASDTVIQARSTTALNGDPGCAATQTYTFDVKNKTAKNEVTIALPYGSWAITSGRSTSSLSPLTISGLIGSVIGSIFGGTGSTANVVTLDPRPAS